MNLGRTPTQLSIRHYVNLRLTFVSSSTVRNETGANTKLGLTADLNPLQLEFMSDLANAAMIPNVMFLVLNGVVGHRFRMDRRCCSNN